MFRPSLFRAKTVVLACALLAQSCAEAQNTQVGAPVIALAASGEATPPPPVLDYSPVPEPENLSAVFRIGSPISDFAIWRDLLPAHFAIAQLIAQGAPGLAQITYGSLGEYVDVGSPADIAMLDEGEQIMVGSVVLRGIASMDKIPADFALKKRGQGSYFVIPREESEDTGLIGKNNLVCAIFPGGEPVELHLACSSDLAALEKAGPFLARTVSRRPITPGIHVDIPEAVISKALSDMGKSDEDASPETDPSGAAGEALGKKWVEDFTKDFSSFSMGVTASPAGVVGNADFRFRAVESPFSVAILGTPGGNYPSLFWDIPMDADTALAVPGATPEALQRVLGTFWTDFEMAMPDQEIPRAVWHDFVGQLQKFLLTGGPLVAAHGSADLSNNKSLPTSPKPPANGKPTAKDVAAAISYIEKVRVATAGWGIVGMAEPLPKWADGVRAAMKISNDSKKKKVAGAAAKPGQSAAAGSASGTAVAAAKPHVPRLITVIEEVKVRPSDGLPTGSIHIVNREKPNPAYKRIGKQKAARVFSTVQHLIIAGHANVTWIIVSENEELALKKVKEALLGGGKGLGSREDLAPLRSAPKGGIGFTSLVGFLRAAGETESDSDMDKLLRATQTPSAGKSPIFLSFVTTPGEAKGTATLRLTANFSIAGALDLIQWLQ